MLRLLWPSNADANASLGDDGSAQLASAALSFEYSSQTMLRIIELLANGVSQNQPSPTGVNAAVNGSHAMIARISRAAAPG